MTSRFESSPPSPGRGPDGVSERGLRSAALLVAVPLFVHRMNNSLMIVRGSLELDSDPRGDARKHQLPELGRLERKLKTLAQLARDPSERIERVRVRDELEFVLEAMEPLTSTYADSTRRSGNAEDVLVRVSSEALRQLVWTILIDLLVPAQAEFLRPHSPLAVQLTVTFDVAERLELEFAASGRPGEAWGLTGQRALDEVYRPRVECWDGQLTRDDAGERQRAYRLSLPIAARVAPVQASDPVAMGRILVVHPSGLEGDMLRMVLEEDGFRVDWVTSVEVGEERLSADVPDLVLWEASMLEPGQLGVRSLEQRSSGVPYGLLGSDASGARRRDALPVPCDPRELRMFILERLGS